MKGKYAALTMTILTIISYSGCMWTNTAAQLEVTTGPGDSPPPRYIVRELQAAYVLSDSASGFGQSIQLQNSVDTLRIFQGEAISKIRAMSVTKASFKELFPLTDQYERLQFFSKHPLIRGPLIRRSIERKQWSEETFEASAILRLSGGQRVEQDILPSESSQFLARMLSKVDALDAIVLDIRGEVIAATGQMFHPSIHRLPEWAHIKAATGDKILVTAPVVEPGYEFLVRRVAVPILMPGEQNVIGWILAKVYAGPLADE